jgi:hypothetical protein
MTNEVTINSITYTITVGDYNSTNGEFSNISLWSSALASELVIPNGWTILKEEAEQYLNDHPEAPRYISKDVIEAAATRELEEFVKRNFHLAKPLFAASIN